MPGPVLGPSPLLGDSVLLTTGSIEMTPLLRMRSEDGTDKYPVTSLSDVATWEQRTVMGTVVIWTKVSAVLTPIGIFVA